MKSMDTELAALQALDVPMGLSTEGYIPAKEKLLSLLDSGLIEVLRTEIVGGWREYHWFRTTAKGRELLSSQCSPTGDW